MDFMSILLCGLGVSGQQEVDQDNTNFVKNVLKVCENVLKCCLFEFGCLLYPPRDGSSLGGRVQELVVTPICYVVQLRTCF